ncbi:MAG: tail fiber protein [Undibacterium sp.]|nr:tail fiber protein [Undibacterium sp.]
MEAFMGMIIPVAFNYPPQNWAFCNGQLLPISQNSALFSLLGTTYGGDGVQSFGLPDLRGRTAVGGQAVNPNLSPIGMGENAGTNNTTVTANGSVSINITANNLPAHTHPATMNATGLTASTTIKVGTGTNGNVTAQDNGGLTSTLATGQPAAAIYLASGTTPTNPVDLGGVTSSVGGAGSVNVLANTGGGQAITAPFTTSAQASVMQPYLGLNYIICLNGIYPSRA